MKADSFSPAKIFSEDGIREVPLFQRSYVWGKQIQLGPLWQDLTRIADNLLEGNVQPPHFLGAVVLQNSVKRTGALQRSAIIDGQQRLTTLQILFDVVRRQALEAGASKASSRLKKLLLNPDEELEQTANWRFKLHPTNRDQAAFFGLLGSESLAEIYRGPQHNLVEAHRFFSGQCCDWLNEKPDRISAIEGLADTLRESLSIVVIDLEPDENAQEIFETLNARGSALTAADLIKNFLFQRVRETVPDDVEKLYLQYWRFFERDFWEEKITAAGNQMNRTSLFLREWLVSKTLVDVPARQIFPRFKAYVVDSSPDLELLLQELHSIADRYESEWNLALHEEGALTPLAHFIYRTQAMRVDSANPVLMAMIGHRNGLPEDAVLKRSLNILESWLVRRMLLRLSTKSYPELMVRLSKLVHDTEPAALPLALEAALCDLREDLAWPGDRDLIAEISHMPIYRKHRRSRVRMILEALEDRFLGWDTEEGAYQLTRVKRHAYHIEHVMPQEWTKNWPLTPDVDEQERDARIHRLGNLTLLPQKLNSKVSNGAWAGAGGKVSGLDLHDNLLINRKILERYRETWDESAIDARTRELAELLCLIWPVPAGHSVSLGRSKNTQRFGISLTDIIDSGYLSGGVVIYPRKENPVCKTAVIHSDGSIEVEGESFPSPSAAARRVTGRATNGWTWWLVGEGDSRTELKEFREAFAADRGLDDTEDDESED